MIRYPPRLWRYYVDDIYMIITKAHSQEFTKYLNMVDPDIKWIMEGEVVETVVNKNADEIVWDRVRGPWPFWTRGFSSSLMV